MGITDEQLLHLREIKYGQPYIRPDLLFFDEHQPVWVYAQIFESDLGFITVGQKAVVTIPSYFETTEGVVSYVTTMIDPQTRSAQARIELPKYRGELMVNMYVEVAIHIDLNDAILIPRQALLDTGTAKIVFVEESPGSYVPRSVQTGFEGDGRIAVTSGLNEGERIVVSGNFLLDSESRLKAAIEGTGGPAQTSANAHAGH
jgi:multidrug efflux pump subunit AcrA (membrane-fusion protein)